MLIFHNTHKKLLHPILTYLICLMNELLTRMKEEGYINTWVKRNCYLQLTMTSEETVL